MVSVDDEPEFHVFGQVVDPDEAVPVRGRRFMGHQDVDFQAF